MLYSQVSETAVSLFWLAFRLVTSANNDSREYNSYRVKYNILKKNISGTNGIMMDVV